MDPWRGSKRLFARWRRYRCPASPSSSWRSSTSTRTGWMPGSPRWHRAGSPACAGPGPPACAIGGYGWVEKLSRRCRTGEIRDLDDIGPAIVSAQDGYIHAPSLQQATTAAVLRSGSLSHPGARHVFGQPELPPRQDRALADRWRAARSEPRRPARLPVRARPARRGPRHRNRNLPQEFPGAGGARAPGQPALATNGSAAPRSSPHATSSMASSCCTGRMHWTIARQPQKVRPIVEDLADALDAVGDLLLAESVHQLVAGNPLRAGLAADTLGRGGEVPDTFHTLTTPHRARALTHRLAALPAAPSGSTGWPVDDIAKLAPDIEAWVAHLLGPAAGWILAASDGSSCTVDRLGMGALATVLAASATDPVRSDANSSSPPLHRQTGPWCSTGPVRPASRHFAAHPLVAGQRTANYAHSVCRRPQQVLRRGRYPAPPHRFCRRARRAGTSEWSSARSAAAVDPAARATPARAGSRPPGPLWAKCLERRCRCCRRSPAPHRPRTRVLRSKLDAWLQRYVMVRGISRTLYDTLLLAAYALVAAKPFGRTGSRPGRHLDRREYGAGSARPPAATSCGTSPSACLAPTPVWCSTNGSNCFPALIISAAYPRGHRLSRPRRNGIHGCRIPLRSARRQGAPCVAHRRAPEPRAGMDTRHPRSGAARNLRARETAGHRSRRYPLLRDLVPGNRIAAGSAAANVLATFENPRPHDENGSSASNPTIAPRFDRRRTGLPRARSALAVHPAVAVR